VSPARHLTLPFISTRAPMRLAILFAVTFSGFGNSQAAEVAAAGNATRIEELERRPIPGTDLEMRLNLVTQPPGYSAPLHHHPGQGFVYMLEGTAESAYGDEAIKRFHAGDHWTEPADVAHRIARNPDTHTVRRFLVFSVNRPGEPSTVFP
jgi:quercetin dioxygenase-like cupin family protein